MSTEKPEPLQRFMPPGIEDVMLFPPPEVDPTKINEFVLQSLCDGHYTMMPALLNAIGPFDDKGIEAIARIALDRGFLQAMIEFAVRAEIEASEDADVMFREDRIHTKVITVVSRQLGESMFRALRDPYLKYLEKPTNMKKARNLIKALCTLEVPAELAAVWRTIASSTGKKFGYSAARDAINGTVLLRFFCKALVDPLAYGLVDEPLHKDVVVHSIAISNVLQGFGTGKQWTEYQSVFQVAKALEPARKHVEDLITQYSARNIEPNFPVPIIGTDDAIAATFVKWWLRKKRDEEFLDTWGRAMRNITDWRDARGHWELGSDHAAWMGWSSFRALIDPELVKKLQTLQKRPSRRLPVLKRKASKTELVDAQKLSAAELVNVHENTSKFVVLVFYRGFWCFFCKKWMREWSRQFERITALGGSLIGITSQNNDTAYETRNRWGIKFPLYGDPENELAKRVHNDIDSKRSNETAVYPYGMGQPSVFAYDNQGRMLHAWTQMAEIRNNNGADDREKPSESARMICNAYALLEKYIEPDEELDYDSDWDSVHSASLDESLSYSTSTTASDFESSLLSCENEEACELIAKRASNDPEFAARLYEATRKSRKRVRRQRRKAQA